MYNKKYIFFIFFLLKKSKVEADAVSVAEETPQVEE